MQRLSAKLCNSSLYYAWNIYYPLTYLDHAAFSTVIFLIRIGLLNPIYKCRRQLLTLLNNCKGETGIEYGLIVGLIFLVIIAALNFWADGMGQMYNSISDAIAG